MEARDGGARGIQRENMMLQSGMLGVDAWAAV